MNEGWLTKPIGEVFRIVNGGTPKTANAAYWDGCHQWITPAEMGGLDSPYLTASRRTLTDEGLRVGAELVPENSIILSSRAPIGHLVINRVPMAFNQGCKGLVPSKAIDTKFAYYFLLANVPLLESLGTGATFKELSGGKLKEVLFRFPSFPEQQRIVGILDEAFAGIAAAKADAEQNRRNAREVFRAALQEIFCENTKWRRVRIDDACESIVDCVNKTAPKADWKTPYKMIRTTNIRNGKVSLDAVNYVTEDVYRIWSRRQIPRRGDIVLTREAPMGEVGMLQSDDLVFLGQRLMSYRVDPALLNNVFLLYAFQSKEMQDQIRAMASGATVQHIRVPDCSKLKVPLPSLDEQAAAVAKLDAVNAETQHLESLYTRKLAALDELKQSLLHEAFSGAL